MYPPFEMIKFNKILFIILRRRFNLTSIHEEKHNNNSSRLMSMVVMYGLSKCAVFAQLFSLAKAFFVPDFFFSSSVLLARG
jgi:hypothetical protein